MRFYQPANFYRSTSAGVIQAEIFQGGCEFRHPGLTVILIELFVPDSRAGARSWRPVVWALPKGARDRWL